ncbi:MAG: hypothetical protein ACRCXZ_03365 [Patescibacteria group bacterium]
MSKTTLFNYLISSGLVLSFSTTVQAKNVVNNSSIDFYISNKQGNNISNIYSKNKQINPCSSLQNRVPDVEQNLERVIRIIQPLINKAEDYVAQQVNMQPYEIEQLFQKTIEEIPPYIMSSLESRGFTIEFYSTESPIPFKITRNCEIEINISKRINVIGGYFLIKYNKKP